MQIDCLSINRSWGVNMYIYIKNNSRFLSLTNPLGPSCIKSKTPCNGPVCTVLSPYTSSTACARGKEKPLFHANLQSHWSGSFLLTLGLSLRLLHMELFVFWYSRGFLKRSLFESKLNMCNYQLWYLFVKMSTGVDLLGVWSKSSSGGPFTLGYFWSPTCSSMFRDAFFPLELANVNRYFCLCSPPLIGLIEVRH